MLEPATGDKTPLLATENVETVPEPVLVTKANAMLWPEGDFMLMLQLLKSSTPARAASEVQKTGEVQK
jgi:hypothetical protein